MGFPPEAPDFSHRKSETKLHVSETICGHVCRDAFAGKDTDSTIQTSAQEK